MDIRHLQIFRMVCDCGGITAAADRLNVTQPSVSIAIRELEAYYHVKLFDRINRGVYPTEAGRLLRQYADAILTPFAEAESVLRTGRAFVQCRIGVNVSVAEAYLGDWIETIRQTAPEIELTAFADNNERLDRLLTENRIDLAVYDGAIDRAAKTVLPLFTETEAAVCAPTLYNTETITPEELSHHPLLLRELGSGQRSAVDNALSRFGYTCAVTSVSTRFGGIGSAGNRVCRGTDAARKASMRKIRAASLYHCRRNGCGGDPARICARPSAPQEPDPNHAQRNGDLAALRHRTGGVIFAQ